MHGHQGQLHQQFVFQQLVQTRARLQGKHVFIAIVVFGTGGGFIHHKTKPAVNGQWHIHGSQATLTGQRHRCVGLQMQPDSRRTTRGMGAKLTLRPPPNPLGRHLICHSMLLITQALEPGQRIIDLEMGARLGKGTHVQPIGIPCHFGVRFHPGSVKECRENTGMSSHRPIPPAQASRPLVLGSTSRYRRELLARLGLPFDVASPLVDETPLPGEKPADLAMRLALAKAREVARRHPHAVVIGCDQVADLHGEPLGKPGTHERAVTQLQRMRGETVIFQTALAVVCQDSGFEQSDIAAVRVVFRQLDDDEIEHYLRVEQPYDCAGSAKSEGLGIALLERIDNDDPTALVGLPLIRTCRMIRAAGVQVL